MRAITVALALALALPACTTSSTDDAAKPEPDAAGPTQPKPDVQVLEAAPDADASDDHAVDAAEDAVADATAVLRDAVWDGPPWTCTKLIQSPACPTPAPTYTDVAPFFKKYCAACHTPADNENMSLYDGIVYQKTNVALDLKQCTMPSIPPWPTMDERQKVLEWLACDAPQ